MTIHFAILVMALSNAIRNNKIIAVVGLSDREDTTSHRQQGDARAGPSDYSVNPVQLVARSLEKRCTLAYRRSLSQYTVAVSFTRCGA